MNLVDLLQAVIIRPDLIKKISIQSRTLFGSARGLNSLLENELILFYHKLFITGSWCGTASGPQQYFSETSTVTASVKVKLTKHTYFMLNVT